MFVINLALSLKTPLLITFKGLLLLRLLARDNVKRSNLLINAFVSGFKCARANHLGLKGKQNNDDDESADDDIITCQSRCYCDNSLIKYATRTIIFLCKTRMIFD